MFDESRNSDIKSPNRKTSRIMLSDAAKKYLWNWFMVIVFCSLLIGMIVYGFTNIVDNQNSEPIPDHKIETERGLEYPKLKP